ncbi:hypothetical protein [Kitasatospora sp. NPDC047058]|uniref:hypothetical protein n=1 Tax=Kitasatospora sp. NPDC047058 TaxID=3155620 RepID=UPI0033D03159
MARVVGGRPTQVETGQVLATPGAVRPHTRVRATLRAGAAPGEGLQLLFPPGRRAVDATADLPRGAGAIASDVRVEVTLNLSRPVVCEEGTDFSVVVQTGDHIISTHRIGTGRVAGALD